MSPLFTSRPKAITFNIRQRREQVLSPLNLHYAGVAALALVCLYLLIRIGISYQQASSQDADALAQQQVTYQTALLSGHPLEGIDAKLKTSDRQADAFYAERLPVNYSEIATKVGAVAAQAHVRLANQRYQQKAVTDVSIGALTRVDMDASLSGDYRGLVEFMNGLERSKLFFVINGVTLTGQQSGVVNLRMRFSTFLRGLSSDEEADRASTPAAGAIDSDIDAQTKALAGGRR